MLSLELAVAGLGFGSLAALSGLGLLITYRATGVFNLAHGAIAMIVAYCYWEAVVQQGWPSWLAAPLCLLVLGPLLGVLAFRVVFRPLQLRAAAPVESLVASLGLFVLLVGVAVVVWGVQAQRARALLPVHRWHLGALALPSDTVVDLLFVSLVLGALWLVDRRTRLGIEMRAVVHGRELAELSRIPVDALATLGWAVGSGFAGITGVLLAPELSLTPYGLTLVVLETFAVPVVARLYSLPIAVGAALLIGVGQSELAQLHLSGRVAGAVLRSLESNLLAVVLLVALLVLPSLREVGGDIARGARFATRTALKRSRGRVALSRALGVLLMMTPLAYPGGVLRDAQQVPALALVFVSLVVLTGYSGQISLGHGAYAGLGALIFAKLSGDITELPALLCGMVAAGIVGLMTGYPAIRRRGLFLALTTFAVGVAVSRFVFQEPVFTTGVVVRRPELFGVSLAGDRVFYAFELICLSVGLLVVRNLGRGRLGRALVAVRDSEAGARSVGLDLRGLKVFIFTVSAALAGLGGGLLAQSTLSFDANAFDPVQSSLFWFTAVVVFGADSAAGAVAAAGLVVMIGALAGSADAALVPIGVFALLLGRLPGGVVDLVRRVLAPRQHTAAPVAPAPDPVLSARGRAVRARALRARGLP